MRFDMSRVQLDRHAPCVPRSNMPFELALAVAHTSIHRQTSWYVCETVRYRANKSLSDLNGTDVRIHGGTIRGLFGALCDVFVRRTPQPSIQDMNPAARVESYRSRLDSGDSSDILSNSVQKRPCTRQPLA
jgi:hypothetical protein